MHVGVIGVTHGVMGDVMGDARGEWWDSYRGPGGAHRGDGGVHVGVMLGCDRGFHMGQ